MENNGNIKLKNGNIFWKWKIGNIFPIWNIDISSICQSPSVSLRFSEKSHEKHLHPLFITAFDENKTRESFPFFFFFFNAIKAADRHRGLAQRGISQSQLIASSFSFFFFFFFVQSVRRQQKDLFTPYHRQSGNNEIRRVYWPVFLSRRANFITETQSATIKLIVNRDIEIRFAFTTPRDSSFRSDN